MAFHDGTAPLIRGFYYPISAPDRYGISRGQGPTCVLIDNRGHQLWLSGSFEDLRVIWTLSTQANGWLGRAHIADPV